MSQDAFLCWLIACADSEDTSIKNLGLDFINFLYNAKNDGNTDIKRDNVSGLVKLKDRRAYPWKQYGYIDVYFQAKINRKIVSFIIEDKTGGEMRDDQLKRYEDMVRGDGIFEDEIKLIYFKTGYMYFDEKEKAKEAGYDIIDLEKIVSFLKNYINSIDSDIFKDYFEYVSGRKTEIDKVVLDAMKGSHHEDRNGRYHMLQHPYAQSEFMLSVKEKLDGVIDKMESGVERDYIIDEPTLDRGTNYGDPFTQFWWAKVKGKYKTDIWEHIIWRIDGGETFRLYLGCWPDGMHYDDFLNDRKSRVERYREIFEEEGRKTFGDALDGPPRKWRVADVSPIGYIYFNSPENSIERILEKFPKFQRNFMNRIFSDKNLNRIRD